MSELLTMYPAQANSPITTLTGALTAGQTSIAVADASVLPAAPNLLVIGGDTVYAETVLMTAKNTSTNMLTVTRAVEGSEFSWPAGSIVGRLFTALEHNILIENISALNEDKQEKQVGAAEGNFAGFDEYGNTADSGYAPGDFASSGHNHAGVYEPNGSVSSHNSSSSAHSSLFNQKAAKSTSTTVNLSASGWNTSGTYPTYTVSNASVTATNVVELVPVMTISKTALEAYMDAHIICTAQAIGSFTLTAYGDKPTVDIPLTMILRGDI